MLLRCILVLILCEITLTSSVDPFKCTKNEECILVRNCTSAVDAIDRKQVRHGYKRCGWDGNDEIVCCPKNVRIETTTYRKAIAACEEYTNLTNAVGGQILDGEPVKRGEFPYMVALGYSGNGNLSWGHCGGTLISYDYVLTAAHCTEFSGGDPMEVSVVRLGKLDLMGNSDNLIAQDINIINVHHHPDFLWKNKQNDIALLHLEKPVIITSFVAPACLHLDTDDPKGNITVLGWGLTTVAGDPSNVLLKTKLKPLDALTCTDIYARTAFPKKINSSQICATFKEHDTCRGDSGGPALIDYKGIHYIVGVTSTGICGTTPGLYTRVASFVPWIESIVWS